MDELFPPSATMRLERLQFQYHPRRLDKFSGGDPIRFFDVELNIGIGHHIQTFQLHPLGPIHQSME
jgi:hypothetical protein